jgi:N-acetylmuramoyl-L-alanine amidase
LPVGCYNEFPEGIRIDNFEIKDGIAYISINESILEEIDKNKYAIPLMQDIIGYNVFNFDKTISEIKFISKDSPSKKFSNLERKNFFETSQLQRVDQGKSLDFINIKDLANKSPEEIREIIQQAILKEKGGDSTLLYENYKVCLDPGHGGGDPGAVVGGIEEADLNLPIGLATREELEEWSGPTFDVVMTRTSDVDVSLTQRYNIANNNNVDCFVSIHCNTSSSSSTNGCTAIYPNNHDISDSNELADVIVDMVEAMTSLSRHRVPYEDDRGLAVLRGTQMPATVVECGFMTNSSDLAYLDNNWDDIGYAISSGIGLWCQITD